jgi:hypothetical protein
MMKRVDGKHRRETGVSEREAEAVRLNEPDAIGKSLVGDIQTGVPLFDTVDVDARNGVTLQESDKETSLAGTYLQHRRRGAIRRLAEDERIGRVWIVSELSEDRCPGRKAIMVLQDFLFSHFSPSRLPAGVWLHDTLRLASLRSKACAEAEHGPIRTR